MGRPYKNRHRNKSFSSKIKRKWRRSSSTAKVLAIVIAIYFTITIVSSVRYYSAYSNLEGVFLLSDYPPPEEKSYLNVLWEMATHPTDAWYYFHSKKEYIYLEIQIRYGKEIGMDTRRYEEVLALDKLQDALG